MVLQVTNYSSVHAIFRLICGHPDIDLKPKKKQEMQRNALMQYGQNGTLAPMFSHARQLAKIAGTGQDALRRNLDARRLLSRWPI